MLSLLVERVSKYLHRIAFPEIWAYSSMTGSMLSIHKALVLLSCVERERRKRKKGRKEAILLEILQIMTKQ